MTFIQDAIRTKSPRFYTERVDRAIFFNVMLQCIAMARSLDPIKKGFFYGKELPLSMRMKDVQEVSMNWHYNDGTPVDRQTAIDVLHCALGKFTEAGEMLENLMNTMQNGASFDALNFAEELFDSQWYDAIGCAAIDMTFENGQAMIIAKLRERFPQAFSDEQAINRNHAAERVVLEGHDDVSSFPPKASDVVRKQERGCVPKNENVICPNCAHEFRAIPVDVQQMLLKAGYVPPFIENAVNNKVDKGEADQ